MSEQSGYELPGFRGGKIPPRVLRQLDAQEMINAAIARVVIPPVPHVEVPPIPAGGWTSPEPPPLDVINPLNLTELRCLICGCTDDDCSQCVAKTGAPCSWVLPDLCSACLEEVPVGWRGAVLQRPPIADLGPYMKTGPPIRVTADMLEQSHGWPDFVFAKMTGAVEVRRPVESELSRLRRFTREVSTRWRHARYRVGYWIAGETWL